MSRRVFLAAIPAVVALPVALARPDADVPTCDHVYVIPPDTQMTIHDDTLRLVSRAPTVLDVRDLPWAGPRTYRMYRRSRDGRLRLISEVTV